MLFLLGPRERPILFGGTMTTVLAPITSLDLHTMHCGVSDPRMDRLPDSEAEELIVEIKAVLRGLLRSNRGIHVAEEIAQDTFQELLRRLSIGWGIGRIRANVHLITRSVRRNWFRKQKRRRLQSSFPKYFDSSIQTLDEGLFELDLADALSKLPGKMRRVVEAVWLNHESRRDVAKAIGIHRNRVSELLGQAAERLFPDLMSDKKKESRAALRIRRAVILVTRQTCSWNERSPVSFCVTQPRGANAMNDRMLPFDEGQTPQKGRFSTLNRKAAVVNKPVYPGLKSHQIDELDWEYHPLSTFLIEWYSRFNEHFRLMLPCVPIRLDPNMRRNCPGHFLPAYNDFGLAYEIGIGVPPREEQAKVDKGQLLGTLLHEQLHLLQELTGLPERRRSVSGSSSITEATRDSPSTAHLLSCSNNTVWHFPRRSNTRSR